MKRFLAALLAASLVSACASPRPKFYPNDYYKSAGEDQSKKDTDDCLAKAKAYVKDHPAVEIAKKTGWGAATGAVIGAAVGLIFGDIKGAIEVGAAAGGAGGLIGGAADSRKPSAMVRAYTDRCLNEKGYSVLGWR